MGVPVNKQMNAQTDGKTDERATKRLNELMVNEMNDQAANETNFHANIPDVPGRQSASGVPFLKRAADERLAGGEQGGKLYFDYEGRDCI